MDTRLLGFPVTFGPERVPAERCTMMTGHVVTYSHQVKGTPSLNGVRSRRTSTVWESPGAYVLLGCPMPAELVKIKNDWSFFFHPDKVMGVLKQHECTEHLIAEMPRYKAIIGSEAVMPLVAHHHIHIYMQQTFE